MGQDALPLARPARKLPTVANRPPARENWPTEQEKRVERFVNEPLVPSIVDPTPEEAQIEAPQVANSESSAPVIGGALAAPPLQPRHHKSQPQLKQQQPTLRRTQSRQLERAHTYAEEQRFSGKNLEPITVSPPQHSDQTEAYDALDVSYYESLIEEVIHEEPQVDLHVRLPEICEEPAAVPANFGDGPAPGLSEPEEYWEGDDEDYDDQGYTTAHSFRSRDMTGGLTAVLQPKATDRVQRELEEARLEVEATRVPEEVEEEYWDVSMVAEYSDEIFHYLREMEVSCIYRHVPFHANPFDL